MTPREEKAAPPLSGFTLLELLVALMLLGLIAALALGGVRLGARTWETVTTKAGDGGRIQQVRAFLSRELAQAVPVLVEDGGGNQRLAYEGDRDRLAFVAPLAPHFLLGGMQRLELVLVDGEEAGRKRLILTRGRFYRNGGTDGPATDEGAEEEEAHLLLDGIAEADFSYRASAREGAVSWSGDWRGRDALPALVRLRIAFADGRGAAWPDLLVAGRITTLPGCMPGEGGTGCRNR